MERPKIKIELTSIDKVIEVTGWVLVSTLWILVITNYFTLPETIPTHYNIAGQADGFGKKGMILTLPLIATVLFVGMTILNKFPHIFNYPTNITEENAVAQYTNATRMIRYLKLIIVIIFGSIAFLVIQNPNGQSDRPMVWLLPFEIGLITVPMAYFLVKSYKKK